MVSSESESMIGVELIADVLSMSLPNDEYVATMRI
jgi:hypothetical protein